MISLHIRMVYFGIFRLLLFECFLHTHCSLLVTSGLITILRAHFQYYCYYFVTLALIQILYSIDFEIYDMIFPCIRRCFDAIKAYHSASISMGFHRAHK